ITEFGFIQGQHFRPPSFGLCLHPSVSANRRQALNSKHDGPVEKYSSPLGSVGPSSPLNKRLGQTHSSGQLPVVLFAVRPVGCLQLAAEFRLGEVLRMCRM